MKQNDASLLKTKEDITFIEKVQNLTIDGISSEMEILADELKRITNIAKNHVVDIATEIINDGDPSVHTSTSPDEIKPVSIKTFVDLAVNQIDILSSALDTLKSKYSSLLEYFGEDPKKKSADFFGTLSKFLLMFDCAIQLVENQEKAKVKRIL